MRCSHSAKALLAGTVLALFSGCAAPTFPQGVTAPQARAAAFPSLLPLKGLLATADAVRPDGAESGDLSIRMAGLDSRAAALRGDVIDAPTRRRMLEMLDRHPG